MLIFKARVKAVSRAALAAQLHEIAEQIMAGERRPPRMLFWEIDGEPPEDSE